MTAREQADGAGFPERLREEWLDPTMTDDTDWPVRRPDTVEAERAGRLVADDDDGASADDVGTLSGCDVGADGGAASAEEAAVHLAGEDVEMSALDAPPPEDDR